MICTAFSSRTLPTVMMTMLFVVAVALLACPGGAAAGSVRLGAATYPTKDQGTVSFKAVELTDTNLSDDEVAKVLANIATHGEADALFAKLDAASIAIAEMTLNARERTFAIRDLRATGVKAGRVDRLTIGSIDGSFEVADVGTTTVKVGATIIEKSDFRATLAGFVESDAAAGPTDAEHIVLSAVDVSVPDQDTPKDAPGGNLFRIKLASFEVTGSRAASVSRTTAVLGDLTIEPPKASTAAQALTQYGYDKIALDVTFGARHDASSKTYMLEDLTITAARIGSIKLEATIGGVDPAMLTGDPAAMASVMTEGDVSHLMIRITNAGYFEKALAVAAASQNKSPQQIKAEWSAAVVAALGIKPGGDPSANSVADAAAAAAAALGAKPGGDPLAKSVVDAVAAFIADPNSLTIAIDSKAGPIKFGALGDIKSLDDLLSLVAVKATSGP